MSLSILQTKLFIQPVPPHLIPRARLTERISKGINLGSKLTLVAAPAGFGKSTVVSVWASQFSNPVAWLKLDISDNHDTGFISYLYAALTRAYPKLDLSSLPIPPDLSVEQVNSVAGLLLNELSAYSDPINLVLDDYQFIDNKNIHKYLEFFLENLPPNTHIILITRIDPALPLSRWRARGELNEIRAADLQFTLEEIETLSRSQTNIPLAADQLALIEERTKGWVTGIKLALLSLSKQENFQKLTQSLSGNQEYIADYLTDEVLTSLPIDLQSFLYQTSILTYISGELCNAVTERQDGQEILEKLASENLFLSSLDESRTWYQYHPLFSELLRKRLFQGQRENVKALFERAINWHEQHGLVNEAVQYAINLKDENRLVSIIEQHIPKLIFRGEFQQAYNWLEELSPKVIWDRPILCVAKAWIVARNLITDQAYQFVDRAEALLQTNPDILSEDQRDLVLGHILTLRPSLARTSGSPPAEQQRLIQQALTIIPEENTALRGLLKLRLGLAYFDLENEEEADRLFNQVASMSGAEENYYSLYGAIYGRTVIANLQGRLHDIREFCLETLQRTENQIHIPWQKLAVQGFAHIALGLIELEWNHLKEASYHLRLGLSLNTGSGLTELQVKGQYALNRLAFVQGRQPEPIDLHKLLSGTLPNLAAYAQSLQAHLWLLAASKFDTGDLFNQAVVWAEEQSLQQSQGYDRDWRIKAQLIYIRIILKMYSRGDAQFELPDLTTILQLLESEQANYKTKGWIDRVIEIMIVKTLVQDALGEKDLALITLGHALHLAQSGGYVRIFLDEGDRIVEYLYACSEFPNPEGEYARFLLTQFVDRPKQPSHSSTIKGNLIEPLTRREEDVLALLAAGLTNNEIGQKLHISLGTVKRHVANINGKLNTNNRTHAVAVARKLKIIN